MKEEHRHHWCSTGHAVGTAMSPVTSGKTGRAEFGKLKDPKGQQGEVVIVKAVIGNWGRLEPSPCGAGLELRNEKLSKRP